MIQLYFAKLLRHTRDMYRNMSLYRMFATFLVVLMSFAVVICLMMGTMPSMPASHSGHTKQGTSAMHILHSKEMASSVSVKDSAILAILLTGLFIGWFFLLPSLSIIAATLNALRIRWRDGLTRSYSVWQVRYWLSLFVRSPDYYVTA